MSYRIHSTDNRQTADVQCRQLSRSVASWQRLLSHYIHFNWSLISTIYSINSINSIFYSLVYVLKYSVIVCHTSHIHTTVYLEHYNCAVCCTKYYSGNSSNLSFLEIHFPNNINRKLHLYIMSLHMHIYV